MGPRNRLRTADVSAPTQGDHGHMLSTAPLTIRFATAFDAADIATLAELDSSRAQPVPACPSSSAAGPGPAAVMANSAASRTALYSKPPLVTQTPLARCTLRTATAIVPDSMPAASGVAAPVSRSAPPAVSAA